jgi:hypothetical protein
MQQHAHDKHDIGCSETEKNGGFAHQALTIAVVIPWT